VDRIFAILSISHNKNTKYFTLTLSPISLSRSNPFSYDRLPLTSGHRPSNRPPTPLFHHPSHLLHCPSNRPPLLSTSPFRPLPLTVTVSHEPFTVTVSQNPLIFFHKPFKVQTLSRLEIECLQNPKFPVNLFSPKVHEHSISPSCSINL
jgi:hypothetical protein